MHLNATRPSISEASLRIMRQLIGHPPRTVSELIGALHVTRTAVMEQIAELMDHHYVEQTIQRDGGRGRPRYLFSATDLAMRQLFEGHQDVVVPAMWRSIRNRYGDESVESVARDVAREISEKYLRQIVSRTYRGRIKELCNLLTCQGRLVECREKKNSIEICKFNCPFISMADETGTLCYIDRLCMQLVVGSGEPAPVKLVSSRNEGHPCCTFQLDLSPKKEMKFYNIGLDI